MLNLAHFDPLRRLAETRDEFERFWTSRLPLVFSAEDSLASGKWVPLVDVYEDRDRYTLEAELPGLSKEDFDIKVEHHSLTLSGERKFEKRTEGGDYHRVERSYGSFTRVFSLPDAVDTEKVSAEYWDGLLRIVLPKKEEVKPRQIQVSVS